MEGNGSSPGRIEIDKLRAALSAFAHIPSEEFDRLLAITRTGTVPKGGMLVRAGETRSSLDFIVSGVIRCFHVEESGAEYTKHFFADGDLIIADRRFLTGDARASEASEYFFEAVEDTRLLSASRADFESRLRHPCWQKAFMGGLLRLQRLEERRIGQLLLADAEARYRLFLEDYPGLEGRVRQRHVASYLGISPVSLSRIRSKIADS